MTQHLLALQDFSKEQLTAYIEKALLLKKEAKAGVRHQQLAGKTVALIFEKPSTRTRVSFESAMYGLGGQVIYLSGRDTQLARNEPLKDMARVMARYVDGMVVRTYGQAIVDELAGYSSVPVINALTDLHHPCQVLSDIMTVIEHKGEVAKLHIAWLGDGNNMANSWIQAAARFGFALTLACPAGYDPTPPQPFLRQPRQWQAGPSGWCATRPRRCGRRTCSIPMSGPAWARSPSRKPGSGYSGRTR